MRHAQRRLQHAQQGAAGGALLLWGAGLDLHFCQLEVPVAVLVPDEAVDGLRRQIEAVFS